jgi:predicted PurR-regulated permease PerM
MPAEVGGPPAAPAVDRPQHALSVRPWVIIGGLIALVAAWVLRDVLLLVFASVLLAVVLRGAARQLQRRTRLPGTASLVVVLGLGVAAFAAVAEWQGPRVAGQIEVLRRELPASVADLRDRLRQHASARQVMEQLPSASEVVGESDEVLAQARSAASATLGVLAAFGLWLFIGVLLALGPRAYVRGILALVPRRHERRTCRVLVVLRRTLWWWSLGRLLAMTFVGVATGIGLWLLDVPLAFLLGVIAALLNFVPNIGPLLAAVPALLLALAADPVKALWVAALYAGVQSIESLVLEPVIDRKTVYLPPALTVTMQVVLGTLAGLSGVALAAPVTAAGMVLVSMLWVEGALGKPGMRSRALGNRQGRAGHDPT